MDENMYWTEKEVSKFTKISLSTLRNQRCKGIGIQYAKIGKSVRYRVSDVIFYMQEHKVKVNY